MLGPDAIRKLADTVFPASRADQTEVVLLGGESSLTRFANNFIHQNVNERDAEIRVRAVVGSRVGVASSNDLSQNALARLAETAVVIAERQPDNTEFPGLPAPRPLTEVSSFSQATADFSPADRARAVKTVCSLAQERGVRAFGAFSTSASEIAVVSTTGVFAHGTSTAATIKSVVMADDSGSGYAQRSAMDARDIDAESVAVEAVETAIRSRLPVEVEPGDYTVVLNEYAVADLLDFLSYMGFSALAVQEGRSFMAEARDKQVVSPLVSIWDDGLDPRGLPSSFDFEGMPKQRVTFLEEGVGREVVYDTITAARDGRDTTGHALPAPNTFGPMPWNMFMAAGDADKDSMLASVERGLLVNRFHYVNVLHPLKTVLTGMTRDGTFLIERGEVTRPVMSLRFTQSAIGALANTTMVSRDRRLHSDEFGASLVPSLLVNGFRFTGVTAG
jgi:PmbA protein